MQLETQLQQLSQERSEN